MKPEHVVPVIDAITALIGRRMGKTDDIDALHREILWLTTELELVLEAAEENYPEWFPFAEARQHARDLAEQITEALNESALAEKLKG